MHYAAKNSKSQKVSMWLISGSRVTFLCCCCNVTYGTLDCFKEPPSTPQPPTPTSHPPKEKKEWGEIRVDFPAKTSSHSAPLPSPPPPPHPPTPFVLCFRVAIPLDVRPTLLRQMDMRSLTCAQVWMRTVHPKGGQAQTSLHKSWLGGTQTKLCLTLQCHVRQAGDRTQGLRIQNSDALTTELRHPLCWRVPDKTLPKKKSSDVRRLCLRPLHFPSIFSTWVSTLLSCLPPLWMDRCS